MRKFKTLAGIAVPLRIANVNTDVLIRVEHMVAVPKGQLGPYCFETWRYRQDGSENPDFILNLPRYRDASILLCGPNFGCGSAREPAVWALWDMGIRCIFAPSFS